MTIPSKANVRPGHIIISMIDVYGRGRREAFDATVLSVDDKGAHTLYLDGHHSRNNHVPWKDMVAKLDRRRKHMDLRKLKPSANFTGHFLVFNQ